jgi:ABC-type antimicrobial peptide transport system permease subunit
MALGAQRSDVVGMVLRDTGRIVLAGLVVGTPLAIIAGSLIANRLFDVRPSDPVTVAIAVVTLGAVTVVAGLVPAYRASRIDPNAALRYD